MSLSFTYLFHVFGAVISLSSASPEKIHECPSTPNWLRKFQENLAPDSSTLKNLQLRVVALLDKDYIHKMQIDTKRRKIYFVGGVGYEILSALQHSLKFHYIPFKETTWIGFRNGSAFGIAPKIIGGWADLAIAEASMIMLSKPTSASYNRQNDSEGINYIDCLSYLHPTSSTKLSVIFRQPHASSMKDIIFSTFSIRIWIAWSVVWCAIFLSLQIIFGVRSIRYADSMVYYFDADITTLSEVATEGLVGRRDAFMWCVSLLSGHGWHEIQTHGTTRKLFISALIFAYLVNIFFSAALTSSLAWETVPIKSFKTLVASKLNVFGDRRLPYVRKIIQNIFKLRRRKHEYSDVRDNFMQVRDLKEVIVNSSSAFIGFEDAIQSKLQWEDYSSRYYCEKVYSLGFITQSFPNAMFVKKGSPLREVLNRKILIAIERGVINRIHLEYLRNTIVTCEKRVHSYRGGLGVNDVFSALSVLVAGMTLSCVALIIDKVRWSVLIRDT